MTTPTPVEVTQKDRDAVDEFHRQSFKALFETDYEDGINRAHALLCQAFARHRTQALADAAAEAEPVAFLVEWVRNGETWVHAHADEPTAVDQARKMGGSCLPLFTRPLADHRALVEALVDDPNWICAGIADDVIEAGMLAWDAANTDMARETPERDWDEGMIVAAIFKAMLRAALKETDNG
jgi:hypothetical protein